MIAASTGMDNIFGLIKGKFYFLVNELLQRLSFYLDHKDMKDLISLYIK